ncbi:MAG: leucine-rich repeat protein [Bacteroidales bacterium]|nr:leucine-rich repeat protein [Bacteroidales bacterium]
MKYFEYIDEDGVVYMVDRIISYTEDMKEIAKLFQQNDGRYKSENNGGDYIERCSEKHKIESFVKEIFLPKEIKNFNVFSESYPVLENYYVEESNPYYSAKDGVLFNKEQTVLKKYPRANKRELYIVPEGVVKIEDRAFDETSNLKQIILPKTTTLISHCAFDYKRNLETLIINSPSIDAGLILGYCAKMFDYVILSNAVYMSSFYDIYRCKRVVLLADSIYFETNEDNRIEDSIFEKLTPIQEIIVPQDKVEKYKEMFSEKQHLVRGLTDKESSVIKEYMQTEKHDTIFALLKQMEEDYHQNKYKINPYSREQI